VKRTALALTLSLALLFSAVAETSFVSLASANWLWPLPDPTPEITVQTPKNGTRYFQNSIPLTLTTTVPFESDITITYKLDNQATVQISSSSADGSEYSAMLTSLSEGWHTLNVMAYGENTDGKSGADTASITFLVDVVPPEVTILSPQNETYTSFDVSLNFTLSEEADWIGYSLDGEALVTVSGNTTLVGLSIGLHNVTVYANDTVGRMGNSATVTFNITQEPEELPASEPEPFPTTLVLTVSGASLAIVIGISLLVYLKKRKPKADARSAMIKWLQHPHDHWAIR
jgi:hypothetical protein